MAAMRSDAGDGCCGALPIPAQARTGRRYSMPRNVPPVASEIALTWW